MKNEALLGRREVSHPFSLKFRGQLSLISKINRIVIPKTIYFWNMTFVEILNVKQPVRK